MVTAGGVKTVRNGRLIREALRVLEEAEEPLKRAEIFERIDARLTFSDSEESFGNAARTILKWQLWLAFASTRMADAGWIVKDRGTWAITEGGRSALNTYSDDLEGMVKEADEAYAAEHPSAGTRVGHYAPVLDAALELLEPGQWASYSDLAALASTNAQTVGSYMSATMTEGAHRVLQKNGAISPGFAWSDGRTDDVREVLASEGLRFGSDGRADPLQHVSVGDLREALESAGVITPASRRAWFVRVPAGETSLPQRWYDRGFVSLQAFNLPDVDPGISRDDLKTVIADAYSQSSYSSRAQKLDDFHAFLTRMQPEDLVVATDGDMLRIGTITGSVEQHSDEDPDALTRDVDWITGNVPTDSVSVKVRSRFQVQSDVVEMTQQMRQLVAVVDAPPDEDGVTTSSSTRTAVTEEDHVRLAPATEKLASSLTLPAAWLQECIDLLEDRPQLILYGPPGTGKTFVAQALAHHLAGDNVRLVQFHPAYSYEDFFEGYRPTPTGGFELRPGPLRKTVDAARENPGTPYFLIIDEINRGNLAKVFGELYFLLEYRDQNVDLLYASDDEVGFTLPDNVFVIGTMNTADRSIALVDAAMRRRFAFVPLVPGDPPLHGMLREWLRKSGFDPGVADLLDELNARIDDRDFRIGPSYFMRPAVHADGGLERAWRTAILPLLEEHHFGEGIDVEERYGLAAIRSAVARRG